MSSFLKLIVTGDTGVGKTCLLMTYLSNEFPTGFIPNICDSYCGVTIHKHPVSLQPFDTAAQEEYDRIRPVVYPHADIILICFSVIDSVSFENVRKKWIYEATRYAPKVPIILVGTKIDLRDDPMIIEKLTSEKKEVIKYEDGINLANEINAECYLECSSLTQQGLNSVFDTTVRVFLSPPNEKKDNCIVC